MHVAVGGEKWCFLVVYTWVEIRGGRKKRISGKDDSRQTWFSSLTEGVLIFVNC